jgi:hypothetical protein
LQTIRELVLPNAWRGKLARFVPVAPRARPHLGKEGPNVEWAGSYAMLGPATMDMFRAKDIEIASKVLNEHFVNQIEDFALNAGGSPCTPFANETSRGRCLGQRAKLTQWRCASFDET